MIRTISPQDMQEMERAFMDGTQYPSILLMEHAAQAVTQELAQIAAPGSRVLFVCGGGNNGGDGCAAARLWMQRGGKADVWLLKNPRQMKGDAGINACLLSSCGASLNVIYGETPEIAPDCAAVVDAMFGTGLCRPLEGAALAALHQINESALPVLAVDIPSGVDGATGKVMGEAVRADVTVTFHRAKHGHMLFPGRKLCGRLVIADIGILPDWDGAAGYEVLEEADAAAMLPVRQMDGHKGTFGHVLAVAGSEGMAGAACLCAQAALSCGCGLVTAACPYPVLLPLQMNVPCAMAKPVCDGAAISAKAANKLMTLAKEKDALAIGPGLGVAEETWRAVGPLVAGDMPKVVDADALNMLARYSGQVGKNTVLTPHPGEMARLCEVSVAEVMASPAEYARELSRLTGACVLLKGATTVIAQGEEISLNITGSDAMATGGSGDVLTGVIAALLAQGMAPYEAARAGAYYHGKAGEAAAKQMGKRAVTAQAIARALCIG
ncbi:MAG: NAD(P)H-hydrate dehydratase [Clostridia bacterium]|nr:NAD(P)H-hydrate dehydratase [Clostridia bacterium]